MLSDKPADRTQKDDEYPFPFRKLNIPDATISEINNMLDWYSGTVLNGQILGRLGVTANKRTNPGAIPDYRIAKLHELINLTGKSVLEVGCFEGIHTLGLRLYSENVTAIDIRPSNVVKTLARLSMHGTNANVFVADVETLSAEFGRFDVIFHCGVLYHLMSPVEHIFSLASMCRYLFLDSHIARDERQLEEQRYRELSWTGTYHGEGGWHNPFSGKDAKSFWLTKPSLFEALRRSGFSTVDTIEEREERNGPRLALLAAG